MVELPDPLRDVARDAFGIDYLYPYQRLVISNTLEADRERRRQVVVLPTGSGKSLCFTLPALLVEGVTVVVYPLLALIDDQARRMDEAGIASVVVRGGQPREERRRLLERIGSGAVRCVLTNPETLGDERLRERLATAGVAHLVIDEAHCVTEWGETFRPAYLTLADAISAIAPRVVTAFTATASPVVLEALTSRLFADEPAHLVQADPDRPNIAYSVVHTPSREQTLVDLVRHGVERPAIVFCRSRGRTESVARELARVAGHDACAAYHAGLPREERTAIERWFHSSGDGILAATCAYGLGVDKANVRTVIHYELPASVEAFLQESGRAGRDRKPARSIVLANACDAPRAADATRAARAALMHGYVATTGCLRAYLTAALGAEPGTCFGCDRCTPGAAHASVALARRAAESLAARAEAMIRSHPRRYTRAAAVGELPEPFEDARRGEIFDTLLAERRLRIIRRGPWRGRLVARSARVTE